MQQIVAEMEKRPSAAEAAAPSGLGGVVLRPIGTASDGTPNEADRDPTPAELLMPLVEEQMRLDSLITPFEPELPPRLEYKPRVVKTEVIKSFWDDYRELLASGNYEQGFFEWLSYPWASTVMPSSEPGLRITFDDGTVLILMGGGPDSAALAEQATVFLGIGGAIRGALTLWQATFRATKHLGRETAEQIADAVVQQVTGLPVGPSGLLPKKGKSLKPRGDFRQPTKPPEPKKSPGSSGETSPAPRVRVPRFWTKTVTFKGLKVYQRSDLIDPKRVDKNGSTNLQRMQSGQAPIAPDGRSLELHHLLQTADGPIAEVQWTFHRQKTRTMHINPRTIPSGIDRRSFERWRKRYWINRAKDFDGDSI